MGKRPLSLQQLERLVQLRRARLTLLVEKREHHKRQLEEIDRQIAMIGGGKVEPRPIRRRPKNEQPLYKVLKQILQQHKRGLVLNELTDKVRESGYKTASANFPNTVYQCLYTNSDTFFFDHSDRRYHLKSGGKAEPKDPEGRGKSGDAE